MSTFMLLLFAFQLPLLVVNVVDRDWAFVLVNLVGIIASLSGFVRKGHSGDNVRSVSLQIDNDEPN